MRAHAPEIEKERQRRYAVTDSRLRNWGLVYRGGGPKLTLASQQDDEKPTLDELDAAVVERAMVDLLAKSNLKGSENYKGQTKQGRHYWKLYRLAKLMYLKDDTPMAVLTDVFRTDERGIQRLHAKLLDYVATYLEIGAVEEWF